MLPPHAIVGGLLLASCWTHSVRGQNGLCVVLFVDEYCRDLVSLPCFAQMYIGTRVSVLAVVGCSMNRELTDASSVLCQMCVEVLLVQTPTCDILWGLCL